MLGFEADVEIVALDEQAGDEADGGQDEHEDVDGVQAVDVGGLQLQLGVAGGGVLDDLDEGGGVLGQVGGVARVRRVRLQVGGHFVLEDDAADGDAQGLAEGAEEDEHGDGEGHVLVRAGRLQLELQPGEQDAQPEPGDQGDEDPRGDRGVDFQQQQEAQPERAQRPAQPDRPPVPASLGDQEARHDGHRGDGEGGGEKGHAGDDGRVALDGLKVQRLVVEELPEDDAVEGGGEEGDVGRAVGEDGQANHRLRGEVGLVEAESHQAHGANEQRHQRAPRRPAVHDATPGQRDEEAGHAADEEHRAEPVDAAQLRSHALRDDPQAQEQRDHDRADADERQIDPENPAPLHRCESAADDGA